jgi:DNA polymerase III epsilon subunit-like protein
MNQLVVFDFETDGKDPYTCNAVQLAALAINPRTLEVVKDSKFCIDIKPPEIDTAAYFTNDVQDTIAWHAKNYKTTSAEIINKWKTAVDLPTAWERFVSYIKRYNPKGSPSYGPIPCGANIRNFDLIIIDRLEKKFKSKTQFQRRDRIDVIELAFYWFENLVEPTSYSMDALREFFGITKEGGHDAFKDVEDCAMMIIKFMNLHRRYSKKIKFKDAFREAFHENCEV